MVACKQHHGGSGAVVQTKKGQPRGPTLLVAQRGMPPRLIPPEPHRTRRASEILGLVRAAGPGPGGEKPGHGGAVRGDGERHHGGGSGAPNRRACQTPAVLLRTIVNSATLTEVNRAWCLAGGRIARQLAEGGIMVWHGRESDPTTDPAAADVLAAYETAWEARKSTADCYSAGVDTWHRAHPDQTRVYSGNRRCR
jgi:hypothetical protein